MKKKETKIQMILFDGESCKCFNVLDFSAKSAMDLPFRDFTGTYIMDGKIGLDKVELDEKRMKQIAKYNAEQDVDFLIRKKQLMEEEIKILEDKKKIIEQKFKQLIDFSNKFLKDKAETMEDYIEENYTDPDYDYYD